jgi:hypothetical protein
MSDQQLLLKSSSEAAAFPKNTIRSNTSQHHLTGYFLKLNEHEERLFCDDGKAGLNLFEYNENTNGPWYAETGNFNLWLIKSRIQKQTHI